MAKFVEQSLNFIKCQQGRFTQRRFREIANNRHMRPHHFSVKIALPQIDRHPSTLIFARSRKKVRIEHTNELAVGFTPDFKKLDIRMIDRIAAFLLKNETI